MKSVHSFKRIMLIVFENEPYLFFLQELDKKTETILSAKYYINWNRETVLSFQHFKTSN